MRDNKQRVVLETNEGCCKDERMLREVWELRLKKVARHMLREVWELRLKKVARHYKIKSVKIMKKPNPRPTKTTKCVRCGEPCTRRLCWDCYTNRKGRYKGRISTLKSVGNRK